MIGGQDGVAGAARNAHTLAALVNDRAVFIVCGADAADIADIVAHQGKHEVHPVGRIDRLMKQPAPQDFLSDQGNENRVLDIVVEGIARPDAFDQEPRAGVQKRRVV